MEDTDTANQERMSDTDTEEFSPEAIELYAIEALRHGKRKAEIVKKLKLLGMDKEQARKIIDNARAELRASEAFRPATLATAIGGGVLAAVIGGVIWGVIVYLSGREIGIFATFVGILCGYGVELAAGESKGFIYQSVAVLTSILGIAIGKYYYIFHLYKIWVAENIGEEAAEELSLFSARFFNEFFAHFDKVASGYTVIWVTLAVIAAWAIPARSKGY